MILDGVIITADLRDILKVLNMQTGFMNRRKETSTDIMVSCPFHGNGHERHPSMGISKVDKKRLQGNVERVIPSGTCRCFTCGATMGFTYFVSRLFGFTDAGEYGKNWLIKNFISVEVEERKPLELNLTRDKSAEEMSYVSKDELSSYRYYHPYMKKRKFTDKMISLFDIGFDPSTNCMTMPVRDECGRVPFVYRRSVVGKYFANAEDTPRGSYLYGYFELMRVIKKYPDRVNTVWVTEAPIDVVSAWQHGRFCVGTFTAQMSDTQVNLLASLPVRSIVSAYDNDTAGDKATEKLYTMLRGRKLLHRMVHPEGAKDLNDINEEDWEGLKGRIYVPEK